MTPREVAQELERLTKLTDDTVQELYQASREWAKRDNDYRMAKAKLYLRATGTVAERQAFVDLNCERERVDAHLADAMRQATMEALRARRSQLQALQSLMGALRSEMELAR